MLDTFTFVLNSLGVAAIAVSVCYLIAAILCAAFCGMSRLVLQWWRKRWSGR